MCLSVTASSCSARKRTIARRRREAHQERNGIELDRLAWLTYPDDPKPKARQRVKVHISQINDLLVSTDCRVINQHGFYRFAEVKW